MSKSFLILTAFVLNKVQPSDAFIHISQSTKNYNTQIITSSSLHMCICIHCKHVTNCSAYHFVEEQHSQPHMNQNPTWEPREGSPTIQVHIRQEEEVNNEWDKLWEEHEDETRTAEEVYAVENNGEQAKEGTLFGKTKYDMTRVTTYEYDVVECEDFLEEKNAWVKNMPEEIRSANPDFVPT